MQEQDDELIGHIRALCKRAREHNLTEDDIFREEDIRPPANEHYLERVHSDRALFERALGGFAATYDIFRIFDDTQIVLDVGAHWGYSVIAMRYQGCNAFVHSVEAMPLNIPALERLKRLEGGHYDYHNVAASDAEGEIRFYVPVLNGTPRTGLATTGGTLRDDFAAVLAKTKPAPGSTAGERQRVGLYMVDVRSKPIDLIFEQDMGRSRPIAAIKMDIEGHEGSALRGARRVLAEFAPLVMIEGANRNPEVATLMAEHRYRHYVRREGKLHLHQARSGDQDGFWVHPTRLSDYRRQGIVADGPDSK